MRNSVHARKETHKNAVSSLVGKLVRKKSRSGGAGRRRAGEGNTRVSV